MSGARSFVAAALLVIMLTPICFGEPPKLRDLNTLDQFIAQFNRDQNRVRLVLLLSPT